MFSILSKFDSFDRVSKMAKNISESDNSVFDELDGLGEIRLCQILKASSCGPARSAGSQGRPML